VIATNSTAAEDRLAKSTLLPKSGNATSALHPISPPLLPLRLAVGRLRTASRPLHLKGYPGKGCDRHCAAVAHGEVIKAAADLVKSLAVSLSTWGMRSNSTSAGRAAGTRRRRILGTAGCACSWSKPFPFPTPLDDSSHQPHQSRSTAVPEGICLLKPWLRSLALELRNA